MLVTHRINYLPFTDHILVMTAGEISEDGRYNELMSHRGPFSKLIATYMTQENEAETSSIECEYYVTIFQLKEFLFFNLGNVINPPCSDFVYGNKFGILVTVS